MFRSKPKVLAHFFESLIILLFLLSAIYVLDDVAQVLSITGILETVSLYAFFLGPLVIVPLAIWGWIKLGLQRFKAYLLISVAQTVVGLAAIYIVMNGQI